MANEFYLKKGDTSPNLETILSDEAGAVNLTDATVVLHMSLSGESTPIISKTATVVMPQTGSNTGRCYVAWVDGDTNVTGTYKAEWKVTFANGKIATFPRSKSPSDFNKIIIQKVVV